MAKNKTSIRQMFPPKFGIQYSANATNKIASIRRIDPHMIGIQYSANASRGQVGKHATRLRFNEVRHQRLCVRRNSTDMAHIWTGPNDLSLLRRPKRKRLSLEISFQAQEVFAVWRETE